MIGYKNIKFMTNCVYGPQIPGCSEVQPQSPVLWHRFFPALCEDYIAESVS